MEAIAVQRQRGQVLWGQRPWKTAILFLASSFVKIAKIVDMVADSEGMMGEVMIWIML